jgi:Domain of unknown function (DUF1839)
MTTLVARPEARHSLHGDNRTWRETNCYTDVWIELLHALGHEPLAMLGPCLRVGLEADQWTFFKPSFDHLYGLYGLDVNETNPWRGLLETCVGAVATGRIAIPEVDSYFLPDTAGVAYRLAHVKSSIAVLGIDPDARWMSYAHNAGCFTVSGDDFDGVFRRGSFSVDASHLPSYVDMCTLPTNGDKSTRDPVVHSFAILQRDLARLPEANPFTAWSKRFDQELNAVRNSTDPDAFHSWAFTTFRQFGPAFELASSHVQWLGSAPQLPLGAHQREALDQARLAFAEIASTALVFQMRAARAVIGKRELDAATWLAPLATTWDQAISALRTLTN